MKNSLIDDLIRLSLSTNESLSIFHDRTRDNSNLNVLKCNKSGVIVLEEILTNNNYYHEAEKKGDTVTTEGRINPQHLEDDLRRFNSYKDYLKDSDLLDFGCGKGGFLKLSNKISKRSVGLELNKEHIDIVKRNGIECFASFDEIQEECCFDIITLNHVLEHLSDPFNILHKLRKLLKDDGTLIIEVPHARDVLIETFDIKDFKNFTFWSEHLILHTRESLQAFVKECGFELLEIKGFQRYPIGNHYHWLLSGKPGGHEVYKELSDNDFHNHYEEFLNKIDQTDTLIGFFKKRDI